MENDKGQTREKSKGRKQRVYIELVVSPRKDESMPGFDGTGPMGMGPMTWCGRRQNRRTGEVLDKLDLQLRRK